MGVKVLVLVLFFVNTAYLVPIPVDLILTLPDGQIRGAKYVTGNNKTYVGFRGIPFGTPPTGELRFEPPQPVQPWGGIWDATSDSKSCITNLHFSQAERESEDCLYINVYIPEVESPENLPVMVWIYGGAFIGGDSTKSFYGPDYLIERDVIFVSFNYRLGTFGFISTGDSVLPGNMGLKDQNLALKWTKNNIEYFGGDPERITVFGQSAGGTSMGLHLVSEKSAGLFRAAIVQSGSAIVPWAVDRDPRSMAYMVADGIPGGNYGNDSQALKAFLKNKTVEEIMASSTDVQDFQTHPWPTLEEESEDAFVTGSSYERLLNGHFNQVPIMIGICAEESLFLFQNLENTKIYAKQLDNDPTNLLPKDLYANSTDEVIAGQHIKSFYIKEGETFIDNLPAAAEFRTDDEFARGIIKHAELTSNYVPVYFYQMAYRGRPKDDGFIPGAETASHGSELAFLFSMGTYSNDTDPTNILTQNRLVTLWTNFAKYLNPTPTVSDLFQNLEWPQFDNKKFRYLNINATLELRRNPKQNTYFNWNRIYQTYGRKPYITF